MTLHPPPLTLPPQRRAVKNIHDFLSFQKSDFRSDLAPLCHFSSSRVGLDSLYPPHLWPCSPAVRGELLVVHFKIFPACFGSLTAKTTRCLFEPASAPV
jgi:hypothetical protein